MASEDGPEGDFPPKIGIRMAVAAALVPASRAARVDPKVALRQD